MTLQRLRAKSGGAAGWLVPALLFLAGMGLMFRNSWLSGPKQSIGDNGDGTILIATLEHWFLVFSGQGADWLSPAWFYPVRHALGFTDTYFLYALPYSVARLLGFGPFGSYTATIATLSVTGFWSFVLLCRLGGVRPACAGVFAFVFAFGALPTFKLGHAQTYAVMLAPPLALLLVWGWRASSWRSSAGFASAGTLYGLVALTAPETAWFLGFDAGLAVLVGAGLNGSRLLGWVRVHWRRAGVAAAWAGVGLAIGLAPIVMVYGQTLGGTRDWPAVSFYLPRFSDLLHVQFGNLLWYDLLHWVGIAGGPGRPLAEVMLGFTPVLIASGLAALFLLPWLRRWAGPHQWDRPAQACLGAVFLAWLLVSHDGHFEPWYLVYGLVPGANGIRTPFRIELASSFFLCFSLAHASSRALGAASTRGLSGVAASVGAALALIAVEQIGPAPTSRNTWEMMRWLLASHRPDFACKAFYVLPPKPGGTEFWYEYQSDAMLLSQWIGMPTINGNSSYYPNGWNMLFVTKPDYARQVLAWIDQNRLRGRVCGVDPRSGRWVDGIGPLQAAAAG